MAPYTRSNKIKGWEAVLDAIKQNAKQYITKGAVLEQIKSLCGMEDAAVESFELTLHCPVSLMRIQVPGRGVRCEHLQCFDLATYLQMRDTSYLSALRQVALQTTPPWCCPICGLEFERRSDDLRVDEYFAALLEAYPQEMGKVNVMSGGTHHAAAVQNECSEEMVIGSESPCPITLTETKPLGCALNGKRVKVELLADDNSDQLTPLPLPVDVLSTESEEAFEGALNASETTRGTQQVSAIPAFHVRRHTFVKPEPEAHTNSGRFAEMEPADTTSANCEDCEASSDPSIRVREGASMDPSEQTRKTATPASTWLTIPVKRKRTSLIPDLFVSTSGDEPNHERSPASLSVAHMTNTATNGGCIVSQKSVGTSPVSKRRRRQTRFDRQPKVPTRTFTPTLCSTLPIISGKSMGTEGSFSSLLAMHTERLKNLGNLHYCRKEYEKALDFYSKSLEIHFSIVALANRAQTHLAMRNYGHAYADASEASLIDPENAECLFRRALALMGVSLWQQAARDLERCKHKGLESGLVDAAFAELPPNYATEPSLIDENMASELGRAAGHEKCQERSLELLNLSLSLNQTQELLNLRAYCHLKLGGLVRAFVDASEALAMGDNCEESSDFARLLREKLGYPYYDRTSWPKHVDVHSIVFKNHCTRYGASLTTVSCADVNGTEVQPSINRNNVQQFFTYHASRPKKMMFENLLVDDECLESLRFMRKVACSDDVAFNGCKFADKWIFHILFRERCQLPEEMTLNALFSLWAIKNAILLSLDFELSPKDAPLHKLVLLNHLASGFPVVRIPADIISGDFEGFFNDLVDLFWASKRKQPYGLAIQLRQLPESVAKVPTLVNKRTEETLSWHVTPLAGCEHIGRQLTMFIVRSSRRHAEKDILKKLEYSGKLLH